MPPPPPLPPPLLATTPPSRRLPSCSALAQPLVSLSRLPGVLVIKTPSFASASRFPSPHVASSNFSPSAPFYDSHHRIASSNRTRKPCSSTSPSLPRGHERCCRSHQPPRPVSLIRRYADRPALALDAPVRVASCLPHGARLPNAHLRRRRATRAGAAQPSPARRSGSPRLLKSRIRLLACDTALFLPLDATAARSLWRARALRALPLALRRHVDQRRAGYAIGSDC